MRPGAWAALLALAAAPVAAAGQGVADAVLGGGDGVVRLEIPTRAEVLVCGDGIRLHGSRHMGRGWGAGGEACRRGPVEVELHVRDGAVVRVETLQRMGDRTAGARVVGRVDAADAVAFLLHTARSAASGKGGAQAVFPVMLADVAEAWRPVMELASDPDAPREARRSALFWLGQEAAAAVTAGLASVAGDENEDQRVREAAVFALSQRPPEEGVPALMEVARSAREPATRRSALFWLAQSDDPAVVPFFRTLILGGREG